MRGAVLWRQRFHLPFSPIYRNQNDVRQISSNVHIPLFTKIKKIIRASEYELEDLHSCVRTKCPVCIPSVSAMKKSPVEKETNMPVSTKPNVSHCKDWFINKITGMPVVVT